VGGDQVGLHIESSGVGYTDLRLTTPSSDYSWSSDFNDDKFILFNRNTGSGLMTIRPTGRITIGTPDPASGLDINGNLIVTEVDTDNSEESIMVLQGNGTVAKREANTVRAGNGLAGATLNGTTLELTLEDGSKIQVNLSSLGQIYTIQERLYSGETPWDIWEDGYPMDSLYGKYYQGGLIFYLNTADGTGLVAALMDQDYQGDYTLGWGCYGTNLSIPDVPWNDGDPTGPGAEIGDGATNTAGIVAECGETGIAARVCDNLYLNGYSDWFLPSAKELNLMWENLHRYKCPKTNDPCPTALGDFTYGWYWSSSESDNFRAWDQAFFSGHQNNYGKDFIFHVRAVRAF
jgi:hypothetical protein